jgi:hypothetical protein
VVADHDPGGDEYLSYLRRSGIVAHDQVGTERCRLPLKGIGLGEEHLVVGAIFSEDVGERLPVYGGCYGEQYAHLNLCVLSSTEHILERRKARKDSFPELYTYPQD